MSAVTWTRDGSSACGRRQSNARRNLRRTKGAPHVSATSQIAEARRRWAAALNSGSADAFVACVTNDAVWLPPRGVAIEGPVALQAWLSDLFNQFRYEFSTSA